MSVFTVREYRPADAAALLALFRDTVRRVNSRDYSPEQVRAWASDEIDPDVWAARFVGRFTAVAVIDETPVGFAELAADGYVDRVYVSADHQGSGVGRAVLTAVLDEATRRGLPRLVSDVSLTARPFFERFGFAVLAEQTVERRGATFTNFRMERTLGEMLS